MRIIATSMALYSLGAAARTPQTEERSASEAGSEVNSENGFGDIIVTARLRKERLQDVPVAATAYTGKDLALYNTESFTSIAARSPSLGVQPFSGSSQFALSLRGIGTGSLAPSSDQAVSINIDGVQFSQSNALRLGLHDLDRVEILKGPQALFFGKNSTAGIISITSADPGTKFEAMLRAGYEFANERKFVEGSISVPLTETLGLRVTAYHRNQNGWFRNDAVPVPSVQVPAFLGGQGEFTPAGVGPSTPTGPDERETFVRGTLVFKAPDQSFEARLKLAYSDFDRKNGYGFVTQRVRCLSPAGPTFVVALGQGSTDCKLDRYFNEVHFSPGVLALDPRLGDDQGRPYTRQRQFLASLTADFRPSDQLTLTSVSGYHRLKDRISLTNAQANISSIGTFSGIDLEQFTQELRLLSSFQSPFNFLAGGFFQHATNNQDNSVAFDAPYARFFSGGFFTGPVQISNYQGRLKTDAWSVFGQAIVDVTSKVQLTAGARYSEERKKAGATSLPYSFSPTTFEVPITPDKRKFTNFSPEATITYKPVDNLTLYGAYRKGFKSGGYSLDAVTLAYGAHVPAG
ncbi:TonB-dependent receptor (plasmid) [Sphingobium sp. SJ10-10]|uniref:TonB-dependent receptor n=1 Tax=Sphingobium sp. SJ10-10 TaxID=3114999 RepID=UPI002EA165EB|nr:TonB-dependent receptor [Sphingobium sp. SJ10-10]